MSNPADEIIRSPVDGQVRFDVPHDPQKGVVESIRVRNVSTYYHSDFSHSLLNVTMTTVTTKEVGEKKHMVVFRGNTRIRPGPLGCADGNPQQWLEVSISSKRVDRVFEGNVDLEFGEMASWSDEDFEKESILDDLCWPAVGVVWGMDRVGKTNENGQGQNLGSQLVYNEGFPVDKQEEDEQVFW